MQQQQLDDDTPDWWRVLHAAAESRAARGLDTGPVWPVAAGSAGALSSVLSQQLKLSLKDARMVPPCDLGRVGDVVFTPPREAWVKTFKPLAAWLKAHAAWDACPKRGVPPRGSWAATCGAPRPHVDDGRGVCEACAQPVAAPPPAQGAGVEPGVDAAALAQLLRLQPETVEAALCDFAGMSWAHVVVTDAAGAYQEDAAPAAPAAAAAPAASRRGRGRGRGL